MLYLKKDQLPTLFELVRKHYGRTEEVPAYEGYTEAIAKMSGVLDGVQNDTFYPTIAHKAAYLFIQTNKGHFFPNGNKRLALVLAIMFISVNGYKIEQLERDEYRIIISKFFPRYKSFQDFSDFFPEEFGLYNLSIIVADSFKYLENFEELKKSVEAFFESSLSKNLEVEAVK